MCLDADDLEEIIGDFLIEAQDLMEQLENDLISLESDPLQMDIVHRVFRSFHTIKGNANFLNTYPIFEEIAKIAHASEDIMGKIRNSETTFTDLYMDHILSALDTIKHLFTQVKSGVRTVQPQTELVQSLRDLLTPTSDKKIDSVHNIMSTISSPEQDTTSSPEQKLVSATEQDTTSSPEQKLVSATEQDTTNSPEQKLVSATEQDTTNSPEQKLVSATEQDTTSSPEQKLVSATEQDINNSPEQDTNTAPEKKSLSESEQKQFDTMSFLKHNIISDSEQNTMSVADSVFDASPPEKNIVSKSEYKKIDTNFPEQKKFNVSVVEKEVGNSSLSAEDWEEILQDFLVESKELIEKADIALVELEKTPNNQKLVDQIFRYLHTLKGNTSFLGFSVVSNLAHAAEDVMKEVRKGNITFSSNIMEVILDSIDYLKVFFSGLARNIRDEGDPSGIIAQLKHCVAPNIQRYVSAVAGEDASNPIFQPRHAISKRTMAVSEQTIRVETTRLDKLMNLAGELVLGRNRLTQVVRLLGERFGEDRLYQELISAVDGINFVSSDLQAAVLKTRMQPIGKIFSRFNRTVRDLAKQMDKEVVLILQGEETELDKTVIDALGDPLTHMLRNSIDHGIESPAERVRAGKKVAGKIVLSACHQGNHVLISIQDDGKGMSRKAILNKAVEQGVVSLHEGERMSDADIFDLIFLPGFSTAQSVSNVSGRGVGMDVVKTSIEKLNGSVEISSQIGVGTIFTIRLPLTLAIIHTLQVSVSEQVFAIPITSVIESLRIHSHQIEYIPKTSVIRFREHVIPLVRLSDVFELKESKNESSNMYVVVVGMAERRIGIVVDNIVGQEEVVVKSMGKWLENTPGISSACIGGDGKVTLIIDVAGIFRLLPHSLSLSVHKSEMSVQHPTPPNSTYILLVEDSRSERKRTRLILESQGNFKVMESIDGKDALNKVLNYPIDLVLTDIEMPELDGYQLTAKIREHRKFRSLPVIAISSHKEMIDRIKGMEVGINLYLPKPFEEEELLHAIRNILKHSDGL